MNSPPATRARPAWSLATRLSVWYAGSFFLLLLLASALLYWVLLDSSDHEDDAYLNEKVNVLATLLLNSPPDSAMVQWEVEGESETRPLARVLSRILSADRRIIAETKGMSAELPVAAFPAASMPGSAPARGSDIRSPSGTPFRVLSAALVPVAGRTAYTIQVAIDVTYEQNLLAGYRKRIWLVLGLGLIASVMVGHAIARRGIRPLQEFSRRIRLIRATTLNERLQADGLPSELSSLAGTFNEMLGRLEDAFARLARFSSDIAHELRTPVNNLRGEVEVVLAKSRTPEEYREVLGSSLEECQRLSVLIDSLLFLARAECPETRIQREQVNLLSELTKIRDFYEVAAGEAGVELDLAIDDSSSTANLDRTLFQRSVGNLIENALAHTPRGGSVKIIAIRKNGTVCVTVSDSGIGIQRDHLPHVFDRFYRVDPARSKATGGAGLGLAIVKSIATLHGGHVEIESKPGCGTRVTLSFPAK